MHEHMIPDGHQAYNQCFFSGRAALVICKVHHDKQANNSVLACEVKVECSSGLGSFKKILQSSATSILLTKLVDQDRM